MTRLNPNAKTLRPGFRAASLLPRMAFKLLLLPGDGIGPDVVRETRRVIAAVGAQFGLDFALEEALVGGAAYEAHGCAITDEAMRQARAADAVLLGAVGGPQWAEVAYDKRPEAGLLRLRKELELFANLRPAICFAALADASPLKRHLVEGLDIMIVRELTGGIYFGEPRGIEDIGGGVRRGVNTQTYDTTEVARIARVAGELARRRAKRVCSVDKRNVMESGLLWHEEVSRVFAADYADVDLSHMLADNCAMQLVREPAQFDVIVTDNLFGDILSDIAAMLTGSLGMLPSASLGEEKGGARAALYEPVHGSAPDIAGQNKANPLASILSFAMALRYSFDAAPAADALERAVHDAVAAGKRTADIAADGAPALSTSAMGDAVLAELAAQA